MDFNEMALYQEFIGQSRISTNSWLKFFIIAVLKKLRFLFDLRPSGCLWNV